MIPKKLDQITEQDLQSLVDNNVLEGKTIEYKGFLTINSDSERKEFLADVSSFANAIGGDLIFGIVEDRNSGAAGRLEGLHIQNVDEEIRRLQDIIKNGLEPRIPSVDIQPIILSNSKTVLIIRILKSWVNPHRVVFKGHDKFYSRSSNGKYPLDVGELRIAFNLSNSTTEKIKRFRENRISEIYANEAPVLLSENAKIILHLIPLSSVSPGQNYELSKLPFDPMRIKPMYSSGWNGRYNLDGYLTYSSFEGKSYSYVQLFRNGTLEAVESSLLSPSKLKIPSIAFEEQIMASFNHYLSFLKVLNVSLPIFCFLTLTGVKGYSMALPKSSIIEDNIIEKSMLLIPEIVIDSFDLDAEKILKPLFDAVWNACGLPRSLNFNSSGKWIGREQR